MEDVASSKRTLVTLSFLRGKLAAAKAVILSLVAFLGWKCKTGHVVERKMRVAPLVAGVSFHIGSFL